MDVFKTRRGPAARVWHIDEPSFTAATDRARPYKQQGKSGVSYYAFCPACDNPIQIIGMFRNEEDASRRRPYGRHTGKAVRGIGEWDQDAYLGCPYANTQYKHGGARRKPRSHLGDGLIRMMASDFNLVVAAWERSTGIHLGMGAAQQALIRWRDDEAWRDYGASYLNLPQMLFYSAPAQNLVRHYIVKGSELCERLSGLDRIRLEPTQSNRYMQVMPSTGRYVRLLYVLTQQTREPEGDTVKESYRLRVSLDGRLAFPMLRVDVDPFWHNEQAHRDRRLTDMAARTLQPIL